MHIILSHAEAMADGTRVALGAVGEAVARNVKRLREDQHLTYVQLSERLSEIGRSVPIIGLRRIERGERRVDADDLTALAYVLGVPPVDLLVPGDAPDDMPYAITPELVATVGATRAWAAGKGLLVDPATPWEFAEATRWMSKERQKEMSRLWFTRDRQTEWNRAINRATTEEEEEGTHEA